MTFWKPTPVKKLQFERLFDLQFCSKVCYTHFCDAKIPFFAHSHRLLELEEKHFKVRLRIKK